MKPKLLLRIAALVILLHAAGHTLGIYTWKKPSGPVPPELVKQMTEQKFLFMGTTGSMAAFYDGMGYASTASLLLVVFLLIIVSGVAQLNSSLVIKILWPLSLFLVFLGIDELIYFFPMAAVFSFLGAVLIFFSISILTRKPD